jgi:hypothetical protein
MSEETARGGREERIALAHNEGNAAGAGIFRVWGGEAGGDSGGSDAGAVGGAESRILKIFRPPTVPPAAGSPAATSAWQTSAAPDHFNYWRRELEVYESGFADAVFGDAGIRAPRLLSVDTREDGFVELWLEDIAGRSGFEVSPERLGRFGYELGVGQARWVGRVPPPTELPWLSRRWLAQYLGHGPGSNVRIDDADWDDPVARVWPAETRRSLRHVWESRVRVLAAAESFPRTLCHLDVWPANFIEDVTGSSVLIDWAFVGDGGIGEDPANLIIDSVTDGLMDIAELPHIVDAVTDGYIDGLVDGGWSGQTGSADEVRTAIMTFGVAKYSWIGAHAIATAVRGRARKGSYNQDDSAAETLARIRPLADLLASWAKDIAIVR